VQKAWLAADGFRLFDPIWTDQPVGHTLVLAALFEAVGVGLARARALTVGFGLVGLAATAMAARELGRELRLPNWSAWGGAAAAVLVLAAAPNFMWASRAVMIGVPTFSLSALAMGFAIGYARRRSTRWLVASACALGLALAIKVQMTYLGPLFACLVVWVRRREPRRGLTELALLAALGLGPLALMMAAYGPSLVWQLVFGTYAETRSDYELDLAANLQVLETWISADNLGLAALAAVGAALCALRRTAACVLALSWLALTLATPLQHSALWAEDHFEPLLFCMSALAGPAIGTLAARSASSARRGQPAGSLAAALRDPALLAGVLALAAYAARLPHQLAVNASLATARGYENDGVIVAPGTPDWPVVEAEEADLRDAIEYLALHSGPEDFVITDDQIIAFHAHRRVPPELAAMSSRRVRIRAISGSELIEISERYDPAVILPWKAQLIHYDSYAEWLRESRRPDRAWSETRIAYLREESG
jgi:hypothetical protein